MNTVEQLEKSVSFIKSKTSLTPTIGVVLGSGLGEFVKKIENPTVIDYADIPGFYKCSVQGHGGKLFIGTIEGSCIAVLQGRIHYYEGHQINEVVHPVRVLGKLGVKSLILTNAAGGMNSEYAQGQLVMITDHINMTGNNPLIGPNIEELGERFPDMSYTYNQKIQSHLLATAENESIELKKGVYVGVSGPTYETPAEIRMFKTMGADLVGMSTVPEAIAAHHMGMKVAGISCVTNLAAGISEAELKHEDIKDVANRVMEDFTKLLHSAIKNNFPDF